MTKQDQLNSLFTSWKTKAHYTNANQFLHDGFINADKYEKANTKILFIGKEANGLQESGDVMLNNWRNKDLSGIYDKSISQWAYGIHNGFPPFDEIDGKEHRQQRYDALQQVAIMEARKCSGGAKCNNLSLETIIQKDKEELHQQICIINPDVIVCCLVEMFLVNALFDKPAYQKSGYTRCVFRWENYKVIDFYHPSAQVPGAAMYSLLACIYQSVAFAQL